MSLSATEGASTWRVDYFYDEEGTPFGGLYRTPSSSTSPTYFSIVTNDHGDVLELCDADGDAFAGYRYDAWGLPQGEGSYATGIWTQSTDLIGSSQADDIASRQILRYAGYAYDEESGFYYCSARYYDPATRQWTSVDPAKADGEESAYQYCGGDPVGQVDPSGNLSRYASKAYHAENLYFRDQLRIRLRLTWKTNGTRVWAVHWRPQVWGNADWTPTFYFPDAYAGWDVTRVYAGTIKYGTWGGVYKGKKRGVIHYRCAYYNGRLTRAEAGAVRQHVYFTVYARRLGSGRDVNFQLGHWVQYGQRWLRYRWAPIFWEHGWK